MVKAKKMSNDIKKYIKYVKKIISIHSKDKKEFIQLLTQKIIEFSNEHDSCSYQDIVDEFGSPNEVAGSYIETLDSDEIIKKLNKKKIINFFISVIIILCISVWGFERYRINQLIDEAKHTKMKTYTAEEYKEKIAKEINKLSKISPMSPDVSVSRTYLDTVFSLPWNKETRDKIDLEKAKEILDDEHYGLEKVKERILEYLAIRKLSKSLKVLLYV